MDLFVVGYTNRERLPEFEFDSTKLNYSIPDRLKLCDNEEKLQS